MIARGLIHFQAMFVGASGKPHVAAAGALEAVACALALEHGLLPPSVGTRTPDPAIPVDLIMVPRTASLRHVLSNSFGFGGSNASLLLSRRGA